MFRRHRPAVFLVVFVAAAMLGGCTVPDQSQPSPSTSSPTPTATASATPTPTPAALSVAGGAKPPTVFDGDCERMIAPATVADIVGFPVTSQDTGMATVVANLGGLACTWEGDGGIIRAAAIPSNALGSAEFPSDQVPYYFEECDPGWVCGWRGEGEGLWTAVSYQLWTGMTRQAVDGWGAEMGAVITSAFASSNYPMWKRDEADWWPVLDCARVGDSLSAQLGADVTGETGGFVDPPSPEVVIASKATRASHCYFPVDAAQLPLELFTAAGEAWAVPSSAEDQAVDTGVPGVTAFREGGYESTISAGYSLTDGVNSVTAYIPTDGAVSAEEMLRAVAVVVADGWR